MSTVAALVFGRRRVERAAATGKEVGRFHCGVKGAHTMAFSPDCQVLAVSAKDTTVLLVDVRKVLSGR